MGLPGATPKQKGYIIGLGKKLGLEIEKEDLSLTDTGEANNMIRSMREALYGKSEDPCEQMRRKLISMARTIGWEKGNKADMKRIDAWCFQYGQYHKSLNTHTYEELVHLVSQFQYGPFKGKFKG